MGEDTMRMRTEVVIALCFACGLASCGPQQAEYTIGDLCFRAEFYRYLTKIGVKYTVDGDRAVAVKGQVEAFARASDEFRVYVSVSDALGRRCEGGK